MTSSRTVEPIYLLLQYVQVLPLGARQRTVPVPPFNPIPSWMWPLVDFLSLPICLFWMLPIVEVTPRDDFFHIP